MSRATVRHRPRRSPGEHKNRCGGQRQLALYDQDVVGGRVADPDAADRAARQTMHLGPFDAPLFEQLAAPRLKAVIPLVLRAGLAKLVTPGRR
jgi:hypothetical protein